MHSFPTLTPDSESLPVAPVRLRSDQGLRADPIKADDSGLQTVSGRLVATLSANSRLIVVSPRDDSSANKKGPREIFAEVLDKTASHLTQKA